MKPNDVIKKMKELGCNSDVEIKKIEQIDGAMEVTFMDDCANGKRKLPKSWEEFCKMFPVKNGEAFMMEGEALEINGIEKEDKRGNNMKDLLPNRVMAESLIVLCQLIQLCKAYNGDWKPDWNADKAETNNAMINVNAKHAISCGMLYFKTKELRDEFMRYFSPLIDKLRPLYGVMEGGEV